MLRYLATAVHICAYVVCIERVSLKPESFGMFLSTNVTLTCKRIVNFVVFVILVNILILNIFKIYTNINNPLKLGGGRNVEFHYYDWSFFSQRQKCLFSSSLLRNHYIKNVFLVHHYIQNHCLFSSSLHPKSLSF